MYTNLRFFNLALFYLLYIVIVICVHYQLTNVKNN